MPCSRLESEESRRRMRFWVPPGALKMGWKVTFHPPRRAPWGVMNGALREGPVLPPWGTESAHLARLSPIGGF